MNSNTNNHSQRSNAAGGTCNNNKRSAEDIAAQLRCQHGANTAGNDQNIIAALTQMLLTSLQLQNREQNSAKQIPSHEGSSPYGGDVSLDRGTTTVPDNVPTTVISSPLPVESATLEELKLNYEKLLKKNHTLEDQLKQRGNVAENQNELSRLTRENNQLKAQLNQHPRDDFYERYFPYPYMRLDTAFLEARDAPVYVIERIKKMADKRDLMRELFHGDLD